MVEEDRKKKEQESAEAISGLKNLKYWFEIHTYAMAFELHIMQ